MLIKLSARFFPHEIADLTVVLGYITATSSPVQNQLHWPLRYALLLWLSLVCMIPFDLEQFDEVGKSGETAERTDQLPSMAMQCIFSKAISEFRLFQSTKIW